MRSSAPPVCTHCQSTKSPLWRRGARQEVLCNACGLYWKHHGTYRPLSLKAAADRKSEVGGSLSSLSDSPGAFDGLSRPVSALSAPPSFMLSGLHGKNVARQLQHRDVRSGGPMRTGNILMTPGQYGIREDSHHHFTERHDHLISLPPLRKDHSFVNAAGRTRQVCAAPVLPNLRSVLDCINTADVKASSPSHSPIKFIINRGVTLYQGDHVALRGDDDHVYFAILLDFWLTEGGRRYFTLRWLIPKHGVSLASLGAWAITPDKFEMGPMHGKVEPMEVIIEVFFSPYRNSMSADQIRRAYISDRDTSGEDGRQSVCHTDSGSCTRMAAETGPHGSHDLSRSRVPLSTAHASCESFDGGQEQEESDDIPVSQIESTEIAAKMLLSMI